MDPQSISDLLVTTLQKQAADETSAIGKIFSERGMSLVERAIPKSEGEKLHVSFQLTAEQQNLLKRNFPGRDIVFSQRDSSSHSYAAAHRLLETDYIYKCFGTTLDPIIDLGGNFVSHLKRKRYNVHCCCPLLDDRDGARFTERFISLKTFFSSHPEEIHEPDYCECRFEKCDRKADYVMAVHATSDLPVTELCQALATKGSKKMIMSIMMDPNMLIRDVGEIPNFNVRWEIDRKKDVVTFDFIDAPCLGYQHKFSTLKQYMTANAVIVGKTKAYRIERKTDFGGVFIIDITEVAGYHPAMVVGGSRSCAWLNLLKNKTIVRTFEGVDCWYADVEKISNILIDTKVLTRVLEASFRQYKPSREVGEAIQNMATMLSSSTNYTIINGVTIAAGESIRFEDYVAVATTIYARTKKLYDEIQSNLDRLGKSRMQPIPKDELSRAGLIGSFFSDLLSNHSEHVITTKRGKKVQYNFDANFEKEVRAFLYSLIGKRGASSHLISDPSLFVPLEAVYETSWGGDSVLTVKGAYEDLVGGILKKKELETAESRKKLEKNEKFERAILSIAKWIEVNPSNELPKGLGDVVALIPEVKMDVEPARGVEETKGLVINKYASEIQECINYYESEMEISEKKLRMIGDHCSWSNKHTSSAWSGDDSRRIYLPGPNVWLGPPSVFKPEPTAQYERGLVKSGYVLLDWDKDSLTISNECRSKLLCYPAVFFDKSCEFCAGIRIVPSLKKALTMDANFERRLVNGVAGCGKTTRILAEGSLDPKNPDLFLTSNRSSAVELRERLPGSNLLKASRVRTCDSFLMHGNKITTERVLFDECFLQHAGCVYAAATLAKARELIMFGDSQQIPFISRIPTMKLRDSRVSADSSVERNVTYRSPMDATAALSKYFYRKSIKTHKVNMRSMEMEPIVSVQQIPTGFDLYITHTQAEKFNLMACGRFDKAKIFTSAEAQGKTVGKVAFVRLTRTSIPLYSGKDPLMGPCHGLVAMSRHTEKFVYFTVADTDSDDLIAKAIRDVKSMSDQALVTLYSVKGSV
ncbi:replicase [Green Sichuan pepper ilarvirus]|nr:replicase [Green Sichuan pepper ilarvirus]